MAAVGDPARSKNQLEEPTKYLDSHDTTDSMKNRRDGLFEALNGSALVNISGKHLTIDTKTAKDMTHFVFQILGSLGTQQVGAVAMEYGQPIDHDTKSGTRPHPANPAEKLENNRALREYSEAIARAADTTTSSVPNLDALFRLQAMVKTHDKHHNLVNLVQDGNPQLIGSLEAKGIGSGPGHTAAYRIYEYASHGLAAEHRRQRELRIAARPLAHLVHSYKPSILLMLLEGAEKKLDYWGVTRVKRMVDILKADFPELQRICRLLQRSVYRPICKGKPLTVSSTPDEELNALPLPEYYEQKYIRTKGTSKRK